MPKGEYIQMETKCIYRINQMSKWVGVAWSQGSKCRGKKSEMEWGKQGRANGVGLELEVSISIHDIIKNFLNVLNSKRNDTPASCGHTGTPVLISKCHPNEREPGLPGEMADSRAGAGEENIKLTDFIVPERKEVLTKMIEICQKNTGTSSKAFPLAKSEAI